MIDDEHEQTPADETEHPDGELPAEESSSEGAEAPDPRRGADRGGEAAGQPTKNPRYWSELLQRGYAPGAAAKEIAASVEARAKLAGPRLMGNLQGRVVLEVDGASQPLVFSWIPTASLNAEAEVPQCTLRLREDTLLRIAAGDLNPQVAMLSDKVRVSGATPLAMYFFNLVAPRPHRG